MANNRFEIFNEELEFLVHFLCDKGCGRRRGGEAAGGEKRRGEVGKNFFFSRRHKRSLFSSKVRLLGRNPSVV